MQRKKLALTAAVVAGVIAAGTLTAYATIFTRSPSLSLTAHRGGGFHRVLGTGRYSYVTSPLGNRICGGLSGHPVTMYTSTGTGIGSSTTVHSGRYKIASAALPAGNYHVYTRVPGRVTGHYGNTYICHDATSPTRTVVIPIHH